MKAQARPPIQLLVMAELVIRFRPGVRDDGKGKAAEPGVLVFRHVCYQIGASGGATILQVEEPDGDRVLRTFSWEDISDLEATPAKVEAVEG